MQKVVLGWLLNLILFQTNQPVSVTMSPYTKMADSLLQYLDKSEVTTSILYDRVFPFARLDEYRNSLDTTNYQHFMQVYNELYSAHYNPKGKLASTDSYDDIVDWYRFNSILPLGIMDMKYNQLKPDAVEKNLIYYKDNYLYDNSSRTESPYEEKKIQMASLMADEIEEGNVTIKLIPELLISNTNKTIDHVEMKIGDKLGNCSLSPGDSVIVSLNEVGLENVSTTVYYTDGDYFDSKSIIEITKAGKNRRAGKIPRKPCQKETVIADIPFIGYDENLPTKGQVEINYYYRFKNANDLNECSVKPLSKPIIVLDGFDPTDKRDGRWIYENNFEYYDQDHRESNMADELRIQGYDIIIVNMPTYTTGPRNIVLPDGKEACTGNLLRAGGDYIERNAMAFIKVIQTINQRLALNNSKEKLVIVGPSMGGLISRYALAYMEKNKMEHNCRLWFSWDATHLGSDLPIGEQYFIEQMANLGLKNVKDLIKKQINVPAAKQELNHHFLANSILPQGAPDFKNRFYKHLDSLGWPTKVRKIAMISGTINGSSQPEGVAGGTALDFSLKMNQKPRLLFFNIAGLVTNPTLIKAKISFSPSQKMGSAEVLRMKVFGIPLEKKYADPFPYSNNSLDLIQGGWYPGFKEMKDNTKGKLKGFAAWMLDPHFFEVIDNHGHQPSGNTLALGKGPHPNPNRKWDDDLSQINFNCGEEKEIPWDAWYAPEINLRHDSLTYEYVWRMMDEINGKHMPQPKVTRNVFIKGSTQPMLAGEKREYKISSPSKQTFYNWKINSSQVKIVGGQGTSEITVENFGKDAKSFNISCEGISECYIHQIKSCIVESSEKNVDFITKNNVL